MFTAQTIEQFKIMKWLDANFEASSVRRVEVLTRNAVRITDRVQDTALVVCRQDGTVELVADDAEAC